MASSFDAFRSRQAPLHSQFIPYHGPPKAKPPSQCSAPKNAPSGADERYHIDEILGIGLGSNTKPMDRGLVAPASYRAEVVDLTILGDRINDETGGEGNDESSGNGGVGDSDCSLRDQRETGGCEQSGCHEEVPIERMDGSSIQRSNPDGRSRGENTIMNDDEIESRPDGDDDYDDHSLQEDGTSVRRDRVDGIPRRELPSESTTNMSRDGNAKTVRFADPLSMTDVEFDDSQEHHRTTPETNGNSGDAQSNGSFDQLTPEANSHALPKAITLPSQSPMEKNVNGQGDFPTLENTSSGGDSESSDDYDGDNLRGYGTLPTRKRKRSLPANTSSQKLHRRMPNATPKQHPKRTARSTTRQKPSQFRSRPLSSRLSVRKPASGAQFGGYATTIGYGDDISDESSEGDGDQGRRPRGNDQPKSIASLGCSRRPVSKRDRDSVRPSRFNAKSPLPLSTHTPPHATGETRSRPSAKGVSPGQALQHLLNIAIHPLSADMAFLTALLNGRGDMGTFSTGQAVKLLENAVGYLTKLHNINVMPLTPGIWFLTCFTYCSSDTAGRQTDQRAPALPSLVAMSTDAVPPRDDDQSSGDDVDDESSNDNDDDSNDEHIGNNDGEPSSSTKNSPWSPKDEDRLRKWKKEGRSWKWICSQFPGRSDGAVRGRWYTKLQGKA